MPRHGRVKKKDQKTFGRALMKNHAAARNRAPEDDPTPPGGARLQSVLEVDSLQEFMHAAIMADRTFEAERPAYHAAAGGLLADPGAAPAAAAADHTVLLLDSAAPFLPTVDFSFTALPVPRRPAWDRSMTAQQLDRAERDAFLDWRRALAAKEEEAAASPTTAHLRCTPYEKNLEVWRQLWRVLERSDVLVQIVDARNPLFYRSEDLLDYAAGLDPPRPMLLLVNKADFLSPDQRAAWARHFRAQGWAYAFYSAVDEQERLNERARARRDGAEVPEGEPADVAYVQDLVDSYAGVLRLGRGPAGAAVDAARQRRAEEAALSGRMLTREELLLLLHSVQLAMDVEPQELLRLRAAEAPEERVAAARFCVGMVGYPNVGKSSCINSLLGVTPFDHDAARVGVGATPGKTKHFQTLVLTPRLMLCDCPGLVFPSFVSSQAEMVCCGVLPINQMRDAHPPASLVAARIPAALLRRTYGMPPPPAGSAAAAAAYFPDAGALLEEYGRCRGYMAGAGGGAVDRSRAARELLRDYVSGKLLYSHAPPGVDDAEREAFLQATLRARGEDGAPATAAPAAEADGPAEPGAAPAETPWAAEGGAWEVEGAPAGDDGDGEAKLDAWDGSGDEDGAGSEAAVSRASNTRPHQRKKRWGKKGKKLRDPNPYGGGEDGAVAAYNARVKDKRAGPKGADGGLL